MSSVIEQIDKLLALAGNNPSESEALSAFTKARELMAKYHISEDQLGRSKEVIGEHFARIVFRSAWKRAIAPIVAENFRCRLFWGCYRGTTRAGFFGYITDAECAAHMFEAVIEYADEQSGRYARDHSYGTASLKNDYLVGFIHGLRVAFQRQSDTWTMEKNDNALAIVVPPEVSEAYMKSMEGMDSTKFKQTIHIQKDENAIRAGHRDAIDYASGYGRSLEDHAN